MVEQKRVSTEAMGGGGRGEEGRGETQTFQLGI